MAIRVCWGHMEPHFWGRRGRRGSAMAPLERAMVVSYRLSIVTVALSVTIQPQFAIECLRRSNQRGGHFGPKFRGVPLGADQSCWGCKSEHPRLTNDEISFEEFQPMWSQFTNVTDRQTDRQTTCDRNTALCTKVHRAVKTQHTTIMTSNTRRNKRRLIVKIVMLELSWRYDTRPIKLGQLLLANINIHPLDNFYWRVAWHTSRKIWQTKWKLWQTPELKTQLWALASLTVSVGTFQSPLGLGLGPQLPKVSFQVPGEWRLLTSFSLN